jgi:hypothetical protein
LQAKIAQMKKLSLTNRGISLLLSVLLLITSVAAKSHVLPKKDFKKNTSEQSSSKKTAKDEPPTIQALTLDAVVAPAVSFEFSQDFYFLPAPVWFLITTVSLPKQSETFYYFFSFFRHVFGHHIAINAP